MLRVGISPPLSQYSTTRQYRDSVQFTFSQMPGVYHYSINMLSVLQNIIFHVLSQSKCYVNWCFLALALWHIFSSLIFLNFYFSLLTFCSNLSFSNWSRPQGFPTIIFISCLSNVWSAPRPYHYLSFLGISYNINLPSMSVIRTWFPLDSTLQQNFAYISFFFQPG
jgi:hypothetical protein